MLELLVALGFILLSRITIGDIISVSSLGKGLISKIGEKSAFAVLKKAIDKTAGEAENVKIKEILTGLKGKEELLHEFRDVSEEAKGKLVLKYFKGRKDVFEDLAKNYYELFCKEATKKDRTFREFVVIELGKLANQGIITDEAVKSVESYLEGIIEALKREKEAESRQFLITDDLKVVSSEILAGKTQIEYVERKEIENVKGALETTNKLLVVGKPGAGKSRFLQRILEVFNGYESFVLIRSFFREDGINSLDVELQELNSFILIWDDLHRVKNEIVNQAINQLEQLAKDYGKEYRFICASRTGREYYQFEMEEIKLDDFRSLELIEKCSPYFGVSVEGVKEEDLLAVGDGTPFYVISLFATSKERGKKRLIGDDLKTLPNDSFKLWQEHLDLLESGGRLSTSEKNVLRSIALAMHAVPRINLNTLEKFYEHVFRGKEAFDDVLEEVVKKFFIGEGGEFYFMHAVQVATIENIHPLKERHIERLREVLASLERDKSLSLLWAFADWLYENKKSEDCLKFRDVFIEKEPNLAGAYIVRGITYADLKQYEKAIEDFNNTIKLNPKYANAYIMRGTTYAKLNQYEKAIKDYNQGIGLNPNLAQAYVIRGDTYAKLNQHEKAIDDYNKGIELDPNDAMAYVIRGDTYAKLNQHERAIEDYNKAIEVDANLVEAYYNRGSVYAELNMYKRAINDYNEAIKLNPKYVDAYITRGNAYSDLKQYERAIEDYDKVLELDPKYAMGYHNRGSAYYKLKQYDRAIENYDRALELRKYLPDNGSQAYTARGIAYYKLKQYERAIEDFNEAIDLNLYDAVAYINRGSAYANLKQYERAIEDFNEAIDLNLYDAVAYINRGSAYANLKQYERAIEDYDKAIKLNPKYAAAYYNRSNAYADLKQYERAIEDYNETIELDPKYADAYGNRGVAYSEIGKYEESARDVKKAGILFLKSGRGEDAVEAFSFCFELRERTESDDVIYCGLALLLVTSDADVMNELRKTQIQDENMREILELTFKKLRTKDIAEITALGEREKREEMMILLELLKRL